MSTAQVTRSGETLNSFQGGAAVFDAESDEGVKRRSQVVVCLCAYVWVCVCSHDLLCGRECRLLK